MSEQKETPSVIYCSRCDRWAGNSPQEVWHSLGGYICGTCAEKEIMSEEQDDDL